MKKIWKLKWQLLSALLGLILIGVLLSSMLQKTGEKGTSEEDPFAQYTNFYDHWWDTSGSEWDSRFHFTKDSVETYYVNDSEIEEKYKARYTRVGDTIAIKDKDVIDFFGYSDDFDEIRFKVLSQSTSQLVYTIIPYANGKAETGDTGRFTAFFREDREFYQIRSGEVEKEDAVTQLEQGKWYQINDSPYIFKLTDVTVDDYYHKKVYQAVFYQKELTDLAVVSWIGAFQAKDEGGDFSRLDFGKYEKSYEKNLLPLHEETVILQDEFGSDGSVKPILQKVDGRWLATGDSFAPRELNGERLIPYIGELEADNKEHQKWIKQAEKLEKEADILEGR